MKDVDTVVDALASNYLAQQKLCETAQETLSILRDELMEQVESRGYIPPRAEKSKRLTGVEYQVTVSRSHSVLVNSRQAEKVQLACMRAGKPALFKRLFRRQFIYQVAEGAMELLRGQLPEGSPRQIRKLFAGAVSIDPNAPRLEVRELKQGLKETSASGSGKDAA